MLLGRQYPSPNISLSLLKSSNFITNWFFGISSTFDKQLLKQILIDTDPTFLKWAIDKIVRWSNQKQTKNLFHIHGTNDKILPLNFVKCNSAVKNGGHLMTLNKTEELNNAEIRKSLKNSKFVNDADIASQNKKTEKGVGGRDL